MQTNRALEKGTWPDLIVRRSEQFDDQVQLLDVRLAGKDGLIREQFAENASAGPAERERREALRSRLKLIQTFELIPVLERLKWL